MLQPEDRAPYCGSRESSGLFSGTRHSPSKILPRRTGAGLAASRREDEPQSRRIVTDTGGVIIATSIIVCGNLAGGGTVESTLLFHRCPPAEQVGYLGDVGGDAPGEQGPRLVPPTYHEE
jgi:hypothetical protein